MIWGCYERFLSVSLHVNLKCRGPSLSIPQLKIESLSGGKAAFPCPCQPVAGQCATGARYRYRVLVGSEDKDLVCKTTQVALRTLETSRNQHNGDQWQFGGLVCSIMKVSFLAASTYPSFPMCKHVLRRPKFFFNPYLSKFVCQSEF